MRIEILDDFVWERYESWTGYSDCQICLKRLPLYDSFWLYTIREHAETRADEHKLKYMKLQRFKESLQPQLRDCVDPFLDQQDKLRAAYNSICLNI
jgi:hypothetical protein